jgi:hypothetical protein
VEHVDGDEEERQLISGLDALSATVRRQAA